MTGVRVLIGVASVALVASTAVASGTLPGDVFQDCSRCPQMIVIPAGTSVMGSDAAEATAEGVPDGLAATERPRHPLTIARTFAVGATEITRAQYTAFVETTGHPDGAPCFVWDVTVNAWDNRNGMTWRNPGFAQADTHPVVCVSWTDAVAYAHWLSDLTGQRYRLLSEAEWEYVARARTTTPRYWSKSQDQACTYANVNDLSRAEANEKLTRSATEVFQCEDRHRYTAPVATFAPNAFGLFDTIGNVWEWTADCFVASYADAPEYGAPRLDGDCTQRMNRGGSWADPPWRTRAAMREWDPPHGRYAQTGFRVARELD